MDDNEEMELSGFSFCVFCTKSDNETELIDIESNSLKYGDELVDFPELISETLCFKVDSGFICSECQEHITQFFFFKLNARTNLNNQDHRLDLIKKLNMFYDDCASPEELIALRFNKCFSVVPEDKRTLMENFQNWQPRVQFQRIEIESSEPCKNESPKIEPVEETGIFTYVTATEIDENVYDEIIVEEDFSSTEALEQELIKADIERQATMEIDPPGPKSLKPSEDQRKWANKTIKTCYSIKQSEDGVIVPIWTCSECDKVYSSAQAIRHHLLAKHKNSNEENHQLNDEIREWIRNEHRERRTIIETADDGNKFEWACNSCKFTCNAGQTFRSHLIETHIKNNKPPVTDSSEKTLNYHQQQWIQSQIKHESIENGWKCMKCDEDFKSEKLLRQHLFYHALNLTTDDFRVAKTTGGRPRKSKSVKFQWTCKDCWFQFSAQRSFDAHMKLHETLHCMNPYTVLHRCEECKMFFREVDDLISHIEGHAEGQSLLVPATGIALQKTILFKRLPIPLDAQEGDSSCGHCGRKLFGDNNCKNHLLIHHVNPLVCPKDGRPFSSMQPYICHLQKVHPEIFPESLNCTHCKLPFDNIYERLAHMKLCDEKKFHCDHCDKKFSNKNYLNSHLKRELGLLSVQCTICDKILKAKDELKIHMRKHTKERPYKCSVCDKRYTTTSARASHMETHKDTVIQCDICSVKFIARRHYMVHYKRYHDETYRQQKLQEQTCQFCSKQFLRKDRLREHLQKAHQQDSF